MEIMIATKQIQLLDLTSREKNWGSYMFIAVVRGCCGGGEASPQQRADGSS
jgi:hypothetical protein